MTEPIVKKVRALMALINSKVSSPTEQELIEFELRWTQMPGMQVHAHEDRTFYVIGDLDHLKEIGILKT